MPLTTSVNLHGMTRMELLNFRRSLLGCLAMVELALSQPLTTEQKSCRD